MLWGNVLWGSVLKFCQSGLIGGRKPAATRPTGSVRDLRVL
jgi:hypothetical protein